VKQSVNQWSRVALAAVLTGALGLAACGRKGPLDPPPSAALPQSPAPAYTPRPGLGEEHYGTPPGAPTTAAPTAAVVAPPPGTPPPPQKTFFLDFLLGK
jgi:predicted small lipoprotein YifL